MTKKRAISLIKAGYTEAIENISDDKKELVSEFIGEIDSFLYKIENCDLFVDDIVYLERLFSRIIDVRIEKYIQAEELKKIFDTTIDEKMNAIFRNFEYSSFQMDILLADKSLINERIAENGEKLKNLIDVILSVKDTTAGDTTSDCHRKFELITDYSSVVMWYGKIFGPLEDEIENINKLEKLMGPQPEFDFAMGREDRDIPQLTAELYINLIEIRLQEASDKLKEYDLPLDSFKEISEYIEKIKGMQYTLGELALINEFYFRLISDRLRKDVNWVDGEHGGKIIAEEDYVSKKNMILWHLINGSNDGLNVKLYDTIRASIKEGFKYSCPKDKSRDYYIYPEVASKLENIIGPQPEYDIIMGREK